MLLFLMESFDSFLSRDWRPEGRTTSDKNLPSLFLPSGKRIVRHLHLKLKAGHKRRMLVIGPMTALVV